MIFTLGCKIRAADGGNDSEWIRFYQYGIVHSDIMNMEKMPLSKTNPYLQNPITRKKLIARSVETSCGVEGITRLEYNINNIDRADEQNTNYDWCNP